MRQHHPGGGLWRTTPSQVKKGMKPAKMRQVLQPEAVSALEMYAPMLCSLCTIPGTRTSHPTGSFPPTSGAH